MVLIVAIGVYPKPLFDRITPAVSAIVANYPAEPGRGLARHDAPAAESRIATLPQDRAR